MTKTPPPVATRSACEPIPKREKKNRDVRKRVTKGIWEKKRGKFAIPVHPTRSCASRESSISDRTKVHLQPPPSSLLGTLHLQDKAKV
ncbi:hypothetical protein G4B88_021056 [Cannabis sativa]|uniref:Uncharacterized protein n=1 Tax=Cannabis sativa TaxID=3483 RepID=A0A7J6HX53_CANSA|nr:hypothetical protein G4B88_021056 [Cannabis sativa]